MDGLIRENLLKMDDLGVPPSMEIPISLSSSIIPRIPKRRFLDDPTTGLQAFRTGASFPGTAGISGVSLAFESKGAKTSINIQSFVILVDSNSSSELISNIMIYRSLYSNRYYTVLICI